MNPQASKMLGSILAELEQVAIDQIPQDCTWWLDKAQRLVNLWMCLKDEQTKYEQLYKKEIVALIEAGDSVAKANLCVEAKSENYRLYRYCKARDEQVSEVVMLAKKRVDAEKLIH